MHFPRSSGILLHPTSLPGAYGIGDLGTWAYRFVDLLAAAQQSVWQMLPLGPTSYGDSPYQSLSTFAGNTNLISLDLLKERGWLLKGDFADAPDFPTDHVDYGAIIPFHEDMLTRAFDSFSENASAEDRAAFETWCAQQAYWLDDFALFVALKAAHDGRPWVEWERPLVTRSADALAAALHKHQRRIDEERFRQWAFFTQWYALKAYANQKGVRLVGDIPIFVAHDSSDVWANQTLFSLDEMGNPTVIAGVPPDYFSETGQRWGNPLYRWDALKADGFAWWIKRIEATLLMVDIVRIDHFRGFDAYWEIPASEPTAVVGRWVPAPGFDLFATLKGTLGESLPIIAEDLGVITPGVVALRDTFGMPGMKILQFAWGGRGGKNEFLPHHHTQNSIVYTGTHDNNTTVGWWSDPAEVDDGIRHLLGSYIGHYVGEIQWELIRLCWASVAHTAITTMQDLLGLGADARMNTPGKPSGNWTWRVLPDQLENAPWARLAALTELYGRRLTQAEAVEAAELPSIPQA